MENYFASQRDNIFKNVAVLIYVFDVESRELEKDIQYYQSCLEAIWKLSKEAKIFCLIHKMDLVQEDQRDAVRSVWVQYFGNSYLFSTIVLLYFNVFQYSRKLFDKSVLKKCL